jgi:hypothetical protein
MSMTFTKHKYLTVGIIAGILLLISPQARARSTEAKNKAAKKACLLGDVEKGTEILADLYIRTNDPTYIYNQGRCYEQNGRNNQAALRFKEYLRKADRLPAEETTALQQRIAALESAASSRETPAPTEALPPSPPSPPEVRPINPVPSVARTSAEPHADDSLGITQSPLPPEPEPSPPAYKRWWFWTGVGVVVAGGVVTAILLTRHSASSSGCSGVGACVP